ncbi:hypothetical protein P1J78_08355 [Psychromarinibacter sp. C21-152]|uniref:Uncharacterized protein n=1 Tax=Psychromarinibacter sediminicola TaxID=3033385 RepID=A0AAE3NQR6_9RHOB|nr:hypothetical protein [Psychromarinibacter sediminicola]MDF0600739.1 hypothetical protein [Psychromarinibacter sediminicola]
MLGLVKLIIFGFVILTVIYVLVWLYSRSVRRERLEDQWDADNPEGGDPQAKETYVEDGMKDYHASIRPKLILLVYVIPVVLIVAVMIVINWS